MQKTLDRATVYQHFLLQAVSYRAIKDIRPTGRGYAFSALLHGKRLNGVVLVKSSDFWERRIHLSAGYASLGLVACFKHDTVLPVAVFSLEDGHNYAPKELPNKYTDMTAVRAERSRHAALVFLGALLCGVGSAHKILKGMEESTRRKYEARMHSYQRRQAGRPLAV